MPYVAGPSLQQLIDKNGPLCEKDVVRMALQITAGLVAAHAQGLVHRDIKPANILVEADVSRVLVTDFGLARAVDDASATQSGYFVGTPNYMSPEQAMGHRVDARSDLFSLGSLIYFMSTGRMPFRAESPLCVLNRISNDEPTNVRQVNSEVSQTIANVISRLLEKAPADRFQSASELHEVLEQYLSYLHQPDVSQPPRIKHRRWSNRSSVHIMLGVLSSVLLLITLAAGLGTGWIRMPSYFKRMENSGPTDWSDGKVTSAKPTTSNDAGEWEPKSSVLDLGSGGAAQSEWAIPSSVANPGEQGVPGELVTIRSHFSGAGVDGYTMYLPSSYNKTDIKYPLLICLQGGNSVGGDFRVIEKGLYLLLHKSHDPRTDLPTMLQDSMIILSPHLKSGEYYHQVDAMKELVEEITTEYRADRRRVYLSGISRGGSGVWGLASRMPNVFAAVAPIAGRVDGITDPSVLRTVPMWVAHNTGDPIAEFEPIAELVREVEETSAPFHRIKPDSTTKDDIEHSRIFAIGQSGDHDAWTDVYNNANFFEWLLKQQLESI